MIAKCEVIADTANPYAWHPVKCGYIVLNVRGGCLYLGECLDEKDLANLFPDDGRGTFIRLTLSSASGPDVELEYVKVAFQRIRKYADREGIVFTFLDVSERQLDVLLSAIATLPAIGHREEASVPFDKVISLNKTDRLTLL
ncbi:MAG: hypothetical protein AAGA68_23885 [Pseudomonadota bacterium]